MWRENRRRFSNRVPNPANHRRIIRPGAAFVPNRFHMQVNLWGNICRIPSTHALGGSDGWEIFLPCMQYGDLGSDFP